MMASARDWSSAQDALRLPPPDLGRADPESRQLVAAQGDDRERSEKMIGWLKMLEPFSTAGAGRSDRQLRLHLRRAFDSKP
jgi:hypothetical protein